MFLTKWVSEHGFEQYRLKNTLGCGDPADQRRRDDYGIRLSGGVVLKSCKKKQDFSVLENPDRHDLTRSPISAMWSFTAGTSRAARGQLSIRASASVFVC